MTTDHAVVIAGGGPTGRMLGIELLLAGLEVDDVLVVERRDDHQLDGTRAGGLNARTIEVLDQRGVADRFLAEGQAMQIHSFAGVPLDIGDLPTRHGYGLALWQRDFERILAGWGDELGLRVLHATSVEGFSPSSAGSGAAGVDVSLSDGRTVRASYLVGCDGGRSVVRKAAGIGFPGTDATMSWLIAEADTDDEPVIGLRPEGGGIGRIDRSEGATGGPYGIVLLERDGPRTGEATEAEVRAALQVAYGTDFGLRPPTFVSRFSNATRQAAAYRAGRVLLAGDAAHIHPPQGGQGLNTGVQDAVNLGWKLARVVAGTAPDDLLDTYHAERHPVGARVQRFSMAHAAISTTDDQHRALVGLVGDLLAVDGARHQLAGMLSALDITYDPGGGSTPAHPLVGRRMPDVDLVTTDGSTHALALLHDARPVLLALGASTSGAADLDLGATDLGAAGPGVDLTPWDDRVRRVRATTSDCTWDLPVVGPVPVPAAVLIRPDGHVAWTGDLTDPSLRSALTTWLGPAAAPA